MKSKSLVLASILAISTAAFAQAPGGPAVPENAPPGATSSVPGDRMGPRPGHGPHGPRGHMGHDDGKPWTRADAMAKAGEHFDRVDTNKDGVVDMTERKAAMKHMRAMHERKGPKDGKVSTDNPSTGGTPK